MLKKLDGGPTCKRWIEFAALRNLSIIICISYSIQNVTRENLDYVGNLGITKASFGSLK